MIWFLLVAGILTAAVLAVLLRPLLLRRRVGAAPAEPVAALYRRELAALDAEAAEGRLAPDEAAAARSEIARRLLAAGEHEPAAADAGAEDASEAHWRYAAAVAIAGLLPAAALAVYFAVGAPSAIDRGAASEVAVPHGSAELAAAAQKIKAHLEKAPDDLKGWTLLGRTLASLGRFPEARDAYRHAIALAPSDAGLHAELGEVLVLAAQGAVTPQAAAEFAKAPEDPRARYYDAEAALQRGDPATAKEKLQALLASAPADAPWRQNVADRLAELSNNPPPATAPSTGPTAGDVAAAQSLTPEQRQAMIRGMVERLAQRLQKQPDDKAGWERLAHAYDVLGEKDKAAAARARAANAAAAAALAPAQTAAAAATPVAPGDAQGWIDRARRLEAEGKAADALAALKAGNAAWPGNPALLEAYMKALSAGLKDGEPTPELVALAAQVNALDAKQPEALWYLGLAAQAGGDHYRAAAYWTKLLSELPSGDTRRAVVEHRLAALR